MTKPLHRHARLIVTCLYVAIVLLLLIFAAVVRDEFGHSGVPVLYAAYPLSLYFYKTHAFLVSICAGGAANAVCLYVLLKGTDCARALRRAR
jgi:hypothetical protein